MIKQKMTREEFFSIERPGVTTLLSNVLGKDELANIPEAVLTQAAQRGKEVHSWIENFILTGEKKEIELCYQVYIDYFLEWYNQYKPKFIASELLLDNEEDGYKGIIDTIFTYKDEKGNKITCMCDWKTSSNLNRFKTMCQLNLYERMYRKNYDKTIDEIRTLSLTKQGWRFSKFEIDDFVNDSILLLNRKKGVYNGE